jgi:hypothetical protein
MAVTATRRARWPAVAAWGLWGLGTLAFLATAWLSELHRRVGRGDLVQLTVRDALPLLLASVSSATVGAVLATRRPRHPVGWLLLGLGVSMIVLGVARTTPATPCWPAAGRCPAPAGRPCSPTPAGSCGPPPSASSCS